MSKTRNIHNNPTGKPYCCYLECDDQDATVVVWPWGFMVPEPGADPRSGFENCTEACPKHIEALGGFEEGAVFYPIEEDHDRRWEKVTVSPAEMLATLRGEDKVKP